MTPREGFKYGFLLRCAEEGLTAEEAEKRAARGLEKQAEDSLLGKALGTVGGDVYSGVKGVATGIPGWVRDYGPWALGLGALGVAGAGGLTGHLLAKTQEGDIDPEEVQRQELIQAYQTQTELARRKAIMAAAQQAQPHYGI
jgi:hypothetical protein